MGIAGSGASGFGEGLKLLFRGRRGDQADGNQAKERSNQSWEDSVAVAEDGRNVVVDEGRVPEDRDESTGGDARDGGGGGGTPPEEGREDDGSQCRRIDGVGVER